MFPVPLIYFDTYGVLDPEEGWELGTLGARVRTGFYPFSAYLPVGDENEPGNAEKNSVMGTV